MNTVRIKTEHVRIRMKAKTEEGEKIVRALAKEFGVDVPTPKKPRKPRRPAEG